MHLLLVHLRLCQDKCNITNYPAAIFDLAAILEIRIFCDASISNINQHILKYIQTKCHCLKMYRTDLRQILRVGT